MLSIKHRHIKMKEIEGLFETQEQFIMTRTYCSATNKFDPLYEHKFYA